MAITLGIGPHSSLVYRTVTRKRPGSSSNLGEGATWQMFMQKVRLLGRVGTLVLRLHAVLRCQFAFTQRVGVNKRFVKKVLDAD